MYNPKHINHNIVKDNHNINHNIVKDKHNV